MSRRVLKCKHGHRVHCDSYHQEDCDKEHLSEKDMFVSNDYFLYLFQSDEVYLSSKSVFIILYNLGLKKRASAFMKRVGDIWQKEKQK